MDIHNTLKEFGFAQNEAWIYETLLRFGECGVSTISTKAEINRRNVYDSLNRLVEKGLVFEIRTATDNKYSAVNPNKLNEMIEEKQKQLASIMPDLQSFYTSTPRKEEVFVYRGLEGLKNYLRDMIHIGEDNYTIGAAGAWNDPRLKGFMERFTKDAAEKKMSFHLLFINEAAKETLAHTLQNFEYKLLPPGYNTTAALDIFGDHVVTFSGVSLGTFGEQSAFTVIINQEIADAYRTWFRLMWDLLPEVQNA